MSDTVRVSPTPIQRNKFDVAVELTQLHFEQNINTTSNDIEGLFAKYYALAEYCEKVHLSKLQKLVPADIVSKVGEYRS
jgi:hypothetical protein